MANASGDTVMDAWSTTKRQFENGNDLLAAESAADLAELHASFQLPDGNGDAANMLGVDMDTFREWLSIWPDDSSFCAEDLTLYTHVNAQTGDTLLYWDYGLGGNNYGTYHFLLAGQPRSSAVHVMSYCDGEILFLGATYDKFKNLEAWPRPESPDAHEVWAQQVKGLIRFYERVENTEGDSDVFDKAKAPVDVDRFPLDDDD